ncbi:hypothetical protein D3C80_1933610 [compost metagenome]
MLSSAVLFNEEEEPVSNFCLNSSINARPEASVSKQPFLPQWQMISLLNKGIWPISPAKPDFP